MRDGEKVYLVLNVLEHGFPAVFIVNIVAKTRRISHHDSELDAIFNQFVLRRDHVCGFTCFFAVVVWQVRVLQMS